MSRILIISNYFPPEIGAASNRIYEMSVWFRDMNYNVEVACPFPNYPTGKIFKGYKGIYKKEVIENIPIHRLYILADQSKNPIKRVISMLSFAFSLWILIFKSNLKKYDYVLIQNSPLLVSFSGIILFKFLYKKKIILNVSDLWPQSAIDLGVMKNNSLSHKFFQKIEKFNYINSNKILGQSEYILQHISGFSKTKSFHYRNLPSLGSINIKNNKFKKITFIYAGLLGVAQGLFDLVKEMHSIDADYEFHLYGDGNEKHEIVEYLRTNEVSKIKYIGSIPKTELQRKLSSYHFAFAPLAEDIKGAFPSKIYELILFDVPVIYIGKGEAKSFIDNNRVGYTIEPNDMKNFKVLINKLIKLSKSDYSQLINNCKLVRDSHLDFKMQFKNLISFINE